MKTTKQIILIALLAFGSISKISANYSKFICEKLFVAHSCYFVQNVVDDDPNVVLQATKVGSEVSLKISFNGNEGNNGSLAIYNERHKLLQEFQVVLKPVPGFSIINLSEYATGTYTCKLTTASGVHNSHFTIN